MGNWGERIFDDDDAANFSYQLDDLSEEDRSACLKSALEMVVSKGHRFDGRDGVYAVAAAALVARELEGGDDFKSVICGPSNPIPPPTRELIEIAERAVLVFLDERSSTDWWFGHDLDDRSFRSMLNQLRTVLSGGLSGNPAALW
ncbi:DUF4259 domain-containing protein [Micromonospora sp. DR5-3]|uniref:DUF4259 domain-containing protein n=1 Tax=unclassified Micromonospora TaxID=2617518 RepID=UPI001651C855|nr:MULTISPECIES: DUF4259 domain-containing protein [unclassified Micromonospora]MCW3816205.1 DUF4259 domain-containing protein [Micromonospora sp. DR5-3]